VSFSRREIIGWLMYVQGNASHFSIPPVPFHPPSEASWLVQSSLDLTANSACRDGKPLIT
jgi:hypothetical protein